MVMIQGESLGQRAGTLPPHDDLVLVEAPNADDTDNMLLARLRAGDELAFRALVDRHRPWLVRHCTRLLGHDAHAAEDAAQESLLKLHAAALRGQPLRVRPWLAVVARNTCVDEQRRRRPDLPGELPEQAAAGHDPLDLDAALADAWSRLAGRHREVLYLREVMGFSYKEIGAVMNLSMAATETLVFRARAALRREYERSGGTSFGSALLGLQLARLGLDRRRDAALSGGVANAAATDPGFSTLTSRLSQFLSTSLPACGEQAIAKVLSVAAGVVMAVAAVIPAVSPFADQPSASPDPVPATVLAQSTSGGLSPSLNATSTGGAEVSSDAMSLKALLGNAVSGDWAPQRPRTEAQSTPTSGPPTTAGETPSSPTPLRDAVAAFRSEDRSTLRRDDSEPGPLRSILADRPRPADRPDRPHPLRSLLADPMPFPIDPLPLDPLPIGELPSDVGETVAQSGDPAPADPAADPTLRERPQGPGSEERPTLREAVKDAARPSDDNVAGHDADLLRRHDG